MEKVYISTNFWEDEKIERCHWMEKLLMLYLLTRKEMTNVGYIEVDLEEVTAKINSKNSAARLEKLARLKESDIRAALNSLRRRRIIMLKTAGRVSIYFVNYLTHAAWSYKIPAGWPRIIKKADPPAKIELAMRKTCVAFCRKRGILVPKGLAPTYR
jgi:hypothetical protein